MARVTYTACAEQAAFCQECDWKYSNRKNGLALAARHHDATGHRVNIDITNLVSYGEDPDDKHPRDTPSPGRLRQWTNG